MIGIIRIGLLAGDGRPLVGKLSIDLNEVKLIFRDIFFGKDGCLGAFRYANGAVNALVGINHKEIGAFMKAVDRANVNTVSTFAVDACFADNVGHGFVFSNKARATNTKPDAGNKMISSAQKYRQQANRNGSLQSLRRNAQVI